jgi:hypothetical protein
MLGGHEVKHVRLSPFCNLRCVITSHHEGHSIMGADVLSSGLVVKCAYLM